MGNLLDTCFGKSASGGLSPKEVQLKQQQNWKTTGLVGLRDQGLKEFPPSLQEAGASLKVIDATNNKLAAVPDYFATFAGLQRLTLTSNVIEAWPAACCNLVQLKTLILDLNQLEELPDEVGHLIRLERLSLYSNRLVRLPRSIGQLKTLQFLNLSNNALNYLPAELGQCSALEELDASRNQISQIPPELGDLKKLKTLQLDDNNIVAVPPELLHGATSMQTLSLHGNPIKPDTLAATDGFQEFEARRRSKYDKAIAGGALLNKAGLDEGVDRQTAVRA